MANETKEASLQQAILSATQSILAIVYHPDFHLNYSSKQDTHSKEEVKYGNRKAMIDVRLKPLVYQLWRAGCETLGAARNGRKVQVCAHGLNKPDDECPCCRRRFADA